jgi:hypothetical protein
VLDYKGKKRGRKPKESKHKELDHTNSSKKTNDTITTAHQVHKESEGNFEKVDELLHAHLTKATESFYKKYKN